MSSEEMNQSSRREFLARVAKTGAVVAPVIATFAMTSKLASAGAVAPSPNPPLDLNQPLDPNQPNDPNQRGRTPNFEFKLPTLLPDTL